MDKFLIFIFSSGISFCITVIIFNLVSSERLALERRLAKITDKNNLSKSKKNEKISTDKKSSEKIKFISTTKLLDNLSDELSVASVPLKVEEFLLIWIMVTVFPSLLVALFRFNIIVCSALVLIGLSVPPVLLRRARYKKMSLFDSQLSDAISIMANSLKSGFSLQQSMQSIAREMPDPISREFSRTLREIQLGISMENALVNLVLRIQNTDLELIVSAVLIQRQVGGNLAEILETISKTIKERLKIKKDVRVLTSSARMSGMIVGLLPVFLLAILMLINPDYMKIFFTTKAGLAMLVVSVTLEIIGFSIVKKIVTIKF